MSGAPPAGGRQAPVRSAEQEAPQGRFTPQGLAVQLRALIGPLARRRLCVAYSGGLDSTALLAALASLRRSQRLTLRALHVRHDLQPDAPLWAQRAAAMARRLRVAFSVVAVSVPRTSGESLEAAARTARYQALARQLQASEVLLTAHHQEDQLETVLLALMRGSGVRGLGAMAPVTAWAGTLLVRPLLEVSRTQLERYVAARALGWSEDPSNRDERFDRNYLRHRLLPLLKQRWPAVAATVSRSAAHLREARELLEQSARSCLAAARDGAALRVSVLARLSPAQRRNALRSWLAERGLTAPDHRRLREIAGPMLAARRDALPVVRWRGGEARRYADRLFALRPASIELAAREWCWRQRARIVFEDGSALALRRERYGDIALAMLPSRLRVCFRRGGERLQRQAGGMALKQLLQADALLPWSRSAVPLLCDGERIIAVADRWLHPAYRATAEHPERGRFRWQPAAGDSN